MTISYASGVDASEVSAYSQQILGNLLAVSNNSHGLVTSVTRDPYDQARVMHDNLIKNGVAYERALYTDHNGHPLPGCQVIDVFEACARLTAVDTIAEMRQKIIDLGPSTVSHHCADPALLNVIDVAMSSLANPHDFVAAAKMDKRVSKVLDEPSNHCIHLEIPQTVTD